MHSIRRSFVRLALPLVAAACVAPPPEPAIMQVTPATEAADLIATDRAFAAAAADRDGITALTAMFAPNVIMPIPGNRFAEGAVQASDALAANPDNARSTLDWVPVRGGISADGQHGFTYGHMTMLKRDGTIVPLKYLAYWIQRPEGWRVAAYKRRPRPAGEVSLAVLPSIVPPRMMPISANTSEINMFQASLRDAERAFSDSAQTMGIGPAFELFGTPDAMNFGGGESADFVIGSEAIGREIGAGYPAGGSPVHWSADRVIVSSTSDLGVTFGMIRPNTTATPEWPAEGVPFFTIWRRATVADPWRYIAE